MVKAKEIMHKHIVGISATTKIAAAEMLAKSSKVNLIPVLDNNRLIGIVLTSDLESHKNKDAEVVSVIKNPVAVQEDDNVEEVSRIMIEKGFGRIPVVQRKENMICVGIITSTDIVKSVKKK